MLPRLSGGDTPGMLLDQICGGRYDVTLSLRTDAKFVTHIASGTLNATLTATGTPPRRGLPPRGVHRKRAAQLRGTLVRVDHALQLWWTAGRGPV